MMKKIEKLLGMIQTLEKEKIEIKKPQKKNLKLPKEAPKFLEKDK
jgi:hypothetical protein